jgi:hypothetical protein
VPRARKTRCDGGISGGDRVSHRGKDKNWFPLEITWNQQAWPFWFSVPR